MKPQKVFRINQSTHLQELSIAFLDSQGEYISHFRILASIIEYSFEKDIIHGERGHCINRWNKINLLLYSKFNVYIIPQDQIKPAGIGNLPQKDQIIAMWDSFPVNHVFIGSYGYNGNKLYIGFIYPERNYGFVQVADVLGNVSVVYKYDGFGIKSYTYTAS